MGRREGREGEREIDIEVEKMCDKKRDGIRLERAIRENLNEYEKEEGHYLH